MQELKRRDFLKSSSNALVGASLIGTSARWAGANDRIRVAVLGLGGRGARARPGSLGQQRGRGGGAVRPGQQAS